MRRVPAVEVGKDRTQAGVSLSGSLRTVMMMSWRETRTHACALVALIGVALLAAGCGSGSSSSSVSSSAGDTPTSMAAASQPASGVVIGTTNSPVGTYLTAADGQALYLWEGDSGGKSNCSGDCASQWPPLITKTTAIPSGHVIAANLGTITRPDGSKQVTYMGHPLYYFAVDSGTGATTGEGVDSFGARWWLVAPSGAPLTSTPPPPAGY